MVSGAMPSVARRASAPRRGLRRSEAAAYIGVGETTFDVWVSDGRMPKPMRPSPGIVLWDIIELDAAFDALREPARRDQDAGREQWDELVRHP